MNYIDIILGIAIIAAAIHGFVKGLVFEVASLVALFLGIWGGIQFSAFAADLVRQNTRWQWEHLELLTFIIIFIIIVIIVHFIGLVVHKMVNAIALGFLNKTAGLFFGIVKAVLILSVILVLYDSLDPKSRIIPKAHKERSQVFEPLKNVAPSIFPFLRFDDKKNNVPDLLRQVNHSRNYSANVESLMLSDI